MYILERCKISERSEMVDPGGFVYFVVSQLPSPCNKKIDRINLRKKTFIVIIFICQAVINTKKSNQGQAALC